MSNDKLVEEGFYRVKYYHSWYIAQLIIMHNEDPSQNSWKLFDKRYTLEQWELAEIDYERIKMPDESE